MSEIIQKEVVQRRSERVVKIFYRMFTIASINPVTGKLEVKKAKVFFILIAGGLIEHVIQYIK